MIEYYYSHETQTFSGTKTKNKNVLRASLLQAVALAEPFIRWLFACSQLPSFRWSLTHRVK